MSRVVCQPPNQQKMCESKSSKSDHVGLRCLKVDDVLVIDIGNKVTKRWRKGGKKGCKRVAIGWQIGDKVAMIIKLATDKSWLATNNVIHHQIFSFFVLFWLHITRMKEKRLNCHRGFMLLFSQFGLHLQTDF